MSNITTQNNENEKYDRMQLRLWIDYHQNYTVQQGRSREGEIKQANKSSKGGLVIKVQKGTKLQEAVCSLW